jgi:hypothetical protein
MAATQFPKSLALQPEINDVIALANAHSKTEFEDARLGRIKALSEFGKKHIDKLNVEQILHISIVMTVSPFNKNIQSSADEEASYLLKEYAEKNKNILTTEQFILIANSTPWPSQRSEILSIKTKSF